MEDEELFNMAIGYVEAANEHFRQPYMELLYDLVDLMQTIRVIQNIMKEREKTNK